MKISGIYSFLMFIYLSGHSQTPMKRKFNAGIGVSLAIPVYNLDYSSTGGGIDAIALYGITDKISITGDVGFVGLPGKSIYPSTAIVPIRAGLRYFPGSKIYIAAKAGLGIYTILKASANHFTYAAAAGYLINQKLETALYYDGYSNKNTSFGYTGLSLSYYFLKR
jgi:hypothetical protein